jgi:hypothetical protein
MIHSGSITASSGSASNALPGRKLVTSKSPRMLEPFEIDLLKQDLKAALAHLREARRLSRNVPALRAFGARPTARRRGQTQREAGPCADNALTVERP